MRRFLCTVAIATVTVTAIATPAAATVCPLLIDPIGDVRWPANLGPYSPQVDIVSADVATGATTLVAVLRLADVDPGNIDLLGLTWRYGWRLDGVTQSVEARRSATGGVVASFSSAGTVLPAAVAFDYTADTITWTVARSAVPGLSAGATFATFSATGNVFSGTADTAAEFTNTYVDGDPGCVPAA